ncbi:MAG: diguanylate cyclase [Clostridia bacterium]|nr:diguanylate cyclase [Clostridia bacterium]
MKKRKFGFATQYTVIVCALLVIVNAVLGIVLIRQSGNAMRTLIRWHMLSVSDTAAAAVDGNLLESLTENDVGTEDFESIAKTLTKVLDAQKDNDIKYIYAAKKQGDHFVFTVDPDPVNPGAFGEDVVYTPAQEIAWSGTSAIDNDTYSDKWGSFYTAWSPVRNSSGKVIGLIGVDFVADWYDAQVKEHSMFVVIFSTLSIVVGALIMVLTTAQLRRRIRTLNSELSVLSEDVEKLSDEIRAGSAEEGKPVEDIVPDRSADAIGQLSGQIRIMQQKLKDYMDYAHEQAYTDSMTGMGNKAAYLDHIKVLNDEINAGTAAFAIAVFDVNGLKKTNDSFGHECGDRIIIDAAAILRRVFGSGRIYRIGGDEFIVVLGPTTEEELDALIKRLDDEIENFNKNEKRYVMTLSFSGGGAVYHPGDDADFKEVFRRADEAMYNRKNSYYLEKGEARR